MSELKLIDHIQLAELSGMAQEAPRLRKNLNVHTVPEDPIQRLFNAMEPGTYVCPHRHARPDGWEYMMAIRGEFAVLLFNDSGQVQKRVDLSATAGNLAVEIPPFTWHGLVVGSTDTVMFEVKKGPYRPLDDKDFAPWAPRENEPGVPLFLRWLERAAPGDRSPHGPRI